MVLYKRNSKDWHQQGFKTIQDVEAAQAAFRRQQLSKKRTGKGYVNRTEAVPDWLHQQEEHEPVQQPQQTQTRISRMIGNVWMRF
ncbi:hypothetical protein HFP64_00010 [Bacillus sp. AC79A.1]